jgi:hypothetical protein
MTLPNKNDKPEFVCHAKRHMTASEFKTYDTMRVMIFSGPHGKEDSLIFHGKLTKLANYNNTSVETENLNIKSLIKKGWLVRLGKQRWRAGRWSTVQYVFLEHDDYVNQTERMRTASWQPCPPYRYDTDTGDNVAPGKLKPGLAKSMDSKRRAALVRAVFTDGLFPMGKPKKRK